MLRECNFKFRIGFKYVREINNAGFELHLLASDSLNSTPNDDDWMIVGLVEGFGTTTEYQSYIFINTNISTGTHKYLLKQIDFNGTYVYSDVIGVHINSTPAEYVLGQNCPNPFNPSTRMKFDLSDNSTVDLRFYNILGEHITTILGEQKDAG